MSMEIFIKLLVSCVFSRSVEVFLWAQIRKGEERLTGTARLAKLSQEGEEKRNFPVVSTQIQRPK